MAKRKSTSRPKKAPKTPKVGRPAIFVTPKAVLVKMDATDLDLIAEAAERVGTKTMTFIREAAVSAARKAAR